MREQVSTQVVTEVEKFLDWYVEAHSIPFRRGNPKEFAAWMVNVYTLFRLPPVLPSADVVKVKCLYGLWNVVIDDRIDYDHEGREDLVDTINVIQEFFSGTQMHSETASGQIMKDFLDGFLALPMGPNSDIAKEFLFLDLLRTTNAFDYERIALSIRGVVTLSEFMEFSTSTVDVRCILDIDLALLQERIHPITIGKLRDVYKILGTAFRLFNDVATFEREFSSENSLNSVILNGIEKEILPQNGLYLPDEEKKRIYREVIPLLYEDIRAHINHCKQCAISKISQIAEMNLEPMAKNFDLVVERVSSEIYAKNW